MDISFSWIFAFIIGGFIIFGAIYGVTKFTHIAETGSSAYAATDLGSLLEQLETSAVSAKGIGMTMSVQSRINNGCDLRGDFGNQQITIDEFIRDRWTMGTVPVFFKNRYLFSEKSVEGKRFFFVSLPFDFPFKISNIVFFFQADQKYCFKDAPQKIRRTLSEINKEAFLFENCMNIENVKKVCFGSGACDVVIDLEGGVVKKGMDRFYFQGDTLMLAAIFSDKNVYECQVNRLMLRTKKLSSLYEKKALLVSEKSCSSPVLNDLGFFIQNLNTYSDSSDIANLYEEADKLGDKNDASKCRLW